MLEEFRLHLLCQVLTASIGDVCILFRYHPCLCVACISLDSFDVAVAAEDATSGSAVVWINCGYVFTDEINAAVSGGNAQLMGSILNWMNGEENATVIESRSMSAETLTVPSNLIMPLGLLFVIVLPLASLIIGVVIFILRRRR